MQSMVQYDIVTCFIKWNLHNIEEKPSAQSSLRRTEYL